jgi:hypothetical protein
MSFFQGMAPGDRRADDARLVRGWRASRIDRKELP